MPLLGFPSCFRNLSLNSRGVALSLHRDDREQGSAEKRRHDPGRPQRHEVNGGSQKGEAGWDFRQDQAPKVKEFGQEKGSGRGNAFVHWKQSQPKGNAGGVYLILLSAFHCAGRGCRAVSTDKGDQGLPGDLQKAITDKGLSRRGSYSRTKQRRGVEHSLTRGLGAQTRLGEAKIQLPGEQEKLCIEITVCLIISS